MSQAGASDGEEPRLCENCEEDLAVVSCLDCDALYCRECSSVLHKSAKKKAHRIAPLPGHENDSDAVSVHSSLSSADHNSEGEYSDDEADVPEAERTVIRPECPDTSRLLEWRPVDMATWLDFLGDPFSEYSECFEAQGVRGASIPALDLKSLAEIGVGNEEHRVRLLDKITRLRLQMQCALVGVLVDNAPDFTALNNSAAAMRSIRSNSISQTRRAEALGDFARTPSSYSRDSRKSSSTPVVSGKTYSATPL